MNKPFIITIVGAESSGKSTLAMQLAEHFQCVWVPEYAREYLSSLDRPYGERDLEIIAERQLEVILNAVNRQSSAFSAPNPLKGTLNDISPSPNDLEDLIQSKIENRMLRPAKLDPGATAQQPSKIQKPNSKILIVDGGMMNLRMWAKIKYKKSIPVVEEALKEDLTDLYLLCKPHKEWMHDPLREAPDLLDRVWIYNLYLEELVRGLNTMEIFNGSEDRKLEMAINIILQLQTA